MHLVGFIIRIYHDARSSECQMCHRRLALLFIYDNLPYTPHTSVDSVAH